MLTQSNITQSLNSVRIAVREWRSAGPLAHVEMPPTEEPLLALEALFSLCHTSDVGQAAKPLVLAVDALEALYRQADFEVKDYGGKRLDNNFAHQFWGSVENVFHAADHPHRNRRVEPVSQLVKDGVPPSQIAKMFGFYHANGEPDVERVRREIETPGTEFYRESWQHPVDAEYWADIEERWDARTEPTAESEPSEEPCTENVARPKASESLDELIEQGVNVPQICKMLDIEEEEVRTRAEELAVKVDNGAPQQRPLTARQRGLKTEADRRESMAAAAQE